jgi:hypothetical protein
MNAEHAPCVSRRSGTLGQQTGSKHPKAGLWNRAGLRLAEKRKPA